ncbi:TonB-dependent receptor [Sandarakinorhabdus cyanobacteriorum]|uniref:TonB-dependent receptor n=1 Tax=Sandarakinorhabdus cyanobacteriorum TaxID=1981098 RepID=A0A255YBB5_9SPHN|nr:TonB-dependent receptor [Sandarakinorhabdus cyanobacteriorum]OYQ26508.1 TonB-dependent receptor [Sandarakinorhabdus cyanobacteriorum]
MTGAPILFLALLMAAPALAQPAPNDSTPPADVPDAEHATPTDTPAVAATGSRSAENAVRQAGDAFGTSIGREVSGLYSRERVRGFSPVVAGNVRIDGLYFDPIVVPSSRLVRATAIRVGPSALGSPFPAPTGIVDLGLRRPGQEAAASLLVGYNTWHTPTAEFDASLPVSSTLSIGVGAGMQLENGFNKTRDHSVEGAFIAEWKPSARLSLLPFFTVRETPIDDHGPISVPQGNFLPPRLPRRQFFGPWWSRGGDTELNAGLIADWTITNGWLLRAGLFRSQRVVNGQFANVVRITAPDGTGTQRITGDPTLYNASTSGELRLTRRFEDGPRRHQIHATLRGRQGYRRFDGSQAVDLGPVNILGVAPNVLPPTLNFGPQQDDNVRQWTGGIAYEGRWDGVGELSVGVQKSEYSKRIGFPDAITATDATPWLYNVTAAAQLADGVTLYGGAVTGLEESGVAPNFAANRNEALPAIRTRQIDAGVRLNLGGGMRMVAGLFEVSKPYFNLDTAGRFDVLGEVINRGVEASLAGPLTDELSIVAGAVLLRPRVTGEAVTRGLVGRLPVGAIAERIEFSADWRPGFAPGLSLDMRLSYRSPEVATVNNLVFVPTRTLIDVGGRYRFMLAGNEAVLRIQTTNLTSQQGFDLRGANAYTVLPGRVTQAYLTVDF